MVFKDNLLRCTVVAWTSVLLFALFQERLQAFPPAPHHLIYGIVRDELGNPIQVTNAVVIFETATGVRLSAEISPGLAAGQNYRISIPMDAGITSDLYMPTAMRPSVSFRIRVRMDNTTYLPIEMVADYSRLGQPGQRTRLDLTLGVDTDGDGLPDAWEQAILASKGNRQTLRDIRPTDDSDGDGLSNIDEYLAGTYAFDKKDGFDLKIVAATSGSSVLEFMAIRGRTYSIESSSDLGNWHAVPFRIQDGGTEGFTYLNYLAAGVKILRVEVESKSGEGLRFFKLMIQ